MISESPSVFGQPSECIVPVGGIHHPHCGHLTTIRLYDCTWLSAHTWMTKRREKAASAPSTAYLPLLPVLRFPPNRKVSGSRVAKNSNCPSFRVSQVVLVVKNPPANAGDAGSISWALADPLEKGMATHSNIRAWKIPGTEEPGGLHP